MSDPLIDPLIQLGCSVVKSSNFDAAMELVGYFGHGLVGATVSVALYVYGLIEGNRRMKKTALAVLVSMVVTGILAELLKLGLRMPRPKLRASYGFPSGHATTAFSLAGALGVSFPGLSPLFYFLATLTGVSRLYFRAHFVRDVLGGAVLGSALAIGITRKLIQPSKARHGPWINYLGWLLPVIVGLSAVAFFLALEKNIQAHKVPDSVVSRITSEHLLVDFGTSEARRLLHYGWSGDEKWMDGKLSVVWAEGLVSELSVLSLNPATYRFFLHVYPFVPNGPACQRVEIKINDLVVTRLLLEQGWHWYEFEVPKAAVETGKNEIHFSFAHAESPKSLGLSTDERRLSVAFDSLFAVPRN